MFFSKVQVEWQFEELDTHRKVRGKEDRYVDGFGFCELDSYDRNDSLKMLEKQKCVCCI